MTASHARDLERMMSVIEPIAPLQRMINSAGLDAAFAIVQEQLPSMRCLHYVPGEKADDWSVPYAWQLEAASLRDSAGKTIVSHRDSPLFVAAYSEPVHGRFTKAEMAPHVRCHPTLPEAFFMEHRNAYDHSLSDWGITLPQSMWDSLSESEQYEVRIDITKDYERSMKVGEVLIEGESDEILCFTAHIDELCNDNLSSCAVLVEFFRELAENTGRPSNYSYQLLLVPETIGTLFYARNNPEKIARTAAMVNLETVGRGEAWLIKRSLRAPRYIDRLMQVTAREVLGEFHTTDFFGGYGNDERIFEYPTIGVPSAALQRYPFEEYHSSLDTPEKLSGEHLLTALAFLRRLRSLIERDFVPKYQQLLPPWLTKHDLYFDSKDEPELFSHFMNQVQYSISGQESLVDLCHQYELPFDTLYAYLQRFVELNFIEAGSTHDLWRH